MKANPSSRAAITALTLALLTSLLPPEAAAFCGFYVGKADASLYNEASQVVMVRHGKKTVLTMMNDYKGELKEFALVVPVPVVLKRKDIRISEKKLVERVDAYSAPRLVEYFDDDPCNPRIYERVMAAGLAKGAVGAAGSAKARAKALGVTIEAQYTVGEYDILILSAKESDGLETWLNENGYKVPPGASKALKPYIRQKLKFFVAKVNLKEHKAAGLTFLRPLQFDFESERFMLPIRLGMVNAKGPQDLLIYALTEKGRVEATNYRTVKLPSDTDIPEFVAGEFPAFYKAMFERQVEKADRKAVFTEYVWNMGWCDPCAADPLSVEELKSLGVTWLDGQAQDSAKPGARRAQLGVPKSISLGGGAVPVMVTRLHVRYSPETFPEDLVFQETKDSSNFQGRYVMNHAWQGKPDACAAAKPYFERLKLRRGEEVKNLVELTGWDAAEIRKKMASWKPPTKRPAFE